MANSNFSQLNVAVPHRTKFDMSNVHTTSVNLGQITPIFVQEMLPNDSINIDNQCFIQQVTQLSCPSFGGYKGSVKSFFVPYRIIWDSWKQFITGGSDGTFSVAPPSVNMEQLSLLSVCEMLSSSDKRTGITQSAPARGTWSTLLSNMGLANVVSLGQSALNSLSTSDDWTDYYSDFHKYFGNMQCNVLPFRAYQRIWWDYYRDSRLISDDLEDQYLDKLDARDTSEKINLFTWTSTDTAPTFNWVRSSWNVFTKQFMTRYACFDKDYFTTASVNPQVGSSPSRVSCLVDSSVNLDTSVYPYCAQLTTGELGSTGKAALGLYSAYNVTGSVEGAHLGIFGDGVGSVNPTWAKNTFAAKPDLLVSKFTIEEIRQADALQRYLETKNIAGGRYIQQLFAQFGIKASADRLDMAEFVSGNDFDIDFNTVTVTGSSSTAGAKTAQMSGFGSSKNAYTAQEHGIFMSLLTLMPLTNHTDGIDPFFTRRTTKEDYFQPEFESTGFEAIQNSEIWCPKTYEQLKNSNTDSVSPTSVFGYTPRYGNLKWKRSVTAGDFTRYSTNGALKMDAYNTNRLFTAQPTLSTKYLEFQNEAFYSGSSEDTDLQESYYRPFTTTSDWVDHFLVNVNNSCTMVRPMIALSAPSILTDDANGHSMKVPFGGIRVN